MTDEHARRSRCRDYPRTIHTCSPRSHQVGRAVISVCFAWHVMPRRLWCRATGSTRSRGSGPRPWVAGLLFLGVGIVAWGKYLMPRGPFVEERHTLATPKPIDRPSRPPSSNAVVVSRRASKLLGGLLGGGMASSASCPLPVAAQPRTAAEGHAATHRLAFRLYVVTKAARRRSGRPRRGSIETVFPEGTENSDRGQAVDQTVLIRVSNEAFTTMKGRETWAPHGYVAYSKVCTHLGCPSDSTSKNCNCWCARVTNRCSTSPTGPCRSSRPAPRPLPQLPLYVDSSGYLRSQSDYHEAGRSGILGA